VAGPNILPLTYYNIFIESTFMFDQIVPVPCGTCKRCCQGGEAIVLQEVDVPNIDLYYGADNLQIAEHDGQRELILKWKPNLDCILLGENGCTVWPNHPKMCQTYDCRLRYRELMAMTRQGRKAWAKSITGSGDSKQILKGYLDVGREMLAKHPIEPNDCPETHPTELAARISAVPDKSRF
jgi:Fe-S-cluster containining protein